MNKTERVRMNRAIVEFLDALEELGKYTDDDLRRFLTANPLIARAWMVQGPQVIETLKRLRKAALRKLQMSDG